MNATIASRSVPSQKGSKGFRPKGSKEYAYRSLVLVSPSSTKYVSQDDLDGVKKDYNAISAFLKEHDFRISTHCNMGNITKAHCVQRLEDFFEERIDETDYYLVVVSGHGLEDDGSFVVGKNKDEYVEPSKVFKIWNGSTASKEGKKT
jgi:hypothetical protein